MKPLSSVASALLFNPLTEGLLALFLVLTATGAPCVALASMVFSVVGRPESARGAERYMLWGWMTPVLLWTAYLFRMLWQSEVKDHPSRMRALLTRLAYSPAYLMISFMCGVCVNLGTIFALGSLLTLQYPGMSTLSESAAVRAILIVGGGGLVFGLGLLARGLWFLAVRTQVENLATSKTRSAALGLVELKGVARRLTADPAPLLRGSTAAAALQEPFYIDDDTGWVRVELPRAEILHDDRFALERRYRNEGVLEEKVLMPGDPVYVLGGLVVDPSLAPDPMNGDRRVLRPYAPPWARPFWAAMSVPLRLMGDAPGDLFLVTDVDEVLVKRLFFRKWRWWCAMGALWTSAALWLLSRAF